MPWSNRLYHFIFSLCLSLFTVVECILLKIFAAPPWGQLCFLTLLISGVDISLALGNEMWADVTSVTSEKEFLRASLCFCHTCDLGEVSRVVFPGLP